MHESISDIGLAGDAIAGLGATNEHAQDDARKIALKTRKMKILWHYILRFEQSPAFMRVRDG